MVSKLNPYVRIILAAKRGEGVHLSAQEVFYLAQDSAVAQVATNTMDGLRVESGGYFITLQGFEDIEASL